MGPPCGCQENFEEEFGVDLNHKKAFDMAYVEKLGKIVQVIKCESHLMYCTWSPLDFKRQIENFHGPNQRICVKEGSGSKKGWYAYCPECNYRCQKHRLNVHNDHGHCKVAKHKKKMCYPNLNICNQPAFVRAICTARDDSEVIVAVRNTVPMKKDERKPRSKGKRSSSRRSPKPRKRVASSSRVPIPAQTSDEDEDDEDDSDFQEDIGRARRLQAEEDIDRRRDEISLPDGPITLPDDALLSGAAYRGPLIGHDPRLSREEVGSRVIGSATGRTEQISASADDDPYQMEDVNVYDRAQVTSATDSSATSLDGANDFQVMHREHAGRGDGDALTICTGSSDMDWLPSQTMQADRILSQRLVALMKLRTEFTTRIEKELDDKYGLEVSATNAPDRIPATPLYALLEAGLIPNETLQSLSSLEELMDLVSKQVGDGNNLRHWKLSIGTYCSSPHEVLNLDFISRCGQVVNAAKYPWADREEEWRIMVKETWEFIKREEEIHLWHHMGKTRREEVAKLRQDELRRRLMEYDIMHGREFEAAVWDHDILFHLCAENDIVRDLLPPMPWNHDDFEAADIVQRLKSSRIDAMIPPREARLMKCKFIVDGKDEP